MWFVNYSSILRVHIFIIQLLMFMQGHPDDSKYNTCKLPPLISGFRSKSTTYRALASGLCSSHVRWLCIISVSSIKTQSKRAGWLQSKIQRNQPLKEARVECDWRAHASYSNKSSTVWGPWATGANCPCYSPPPPHPPTPVGGTAHVQ